MTTEIKPDKAFDFNIISRCLLHILKFWCLNI